jgi:hypothetical protein
VSFTLKCSCVSLILCLAVLPLVPRTTPLILIEFLGMLASMLLVSGYDYIRENFKIVFQTASETKEAACDHHKEETMRHPV